MDEERVIYKMGVHLAKLKEPSSFNSTGKNDKKLHITYSEWDDLLSIFRITAGDGKVKEVFRTYLGTVVTYVKEYNEWQKILQEEYQKRQNKK